MPNFPSHRATRVRPVSGALIGFIVGTALQLQQVMLWSWRSYLVLVVLACVVMGWAVIKRWANVPFIVASLVAFSLIACGLTGLRALAFSSDALDPKVEGREVVLIGVVAAMPRASSSSAHFAFDVESAQVHGQTIRVPPRIYLGWYRGPFNGVGAEQPLETAEPLATVVAGERWQFSVRLKAPHGASNPFGFDYELWLWEQGLQASGTVRTGAKVAPPKRLGQSGLHPLERARQHVRDSILKKVSDRQIAGLIAALAVGDQNAIDQSDWDVFRATGVSHLMSISGLHITMFAWVAALILGRLWRKSPALCLRVPAVFGALIGGVLLAGAYALFSGWGVPSQRTVLMLAVVALLRLSGKSWPWPQVWLLAGAAVVALDPWALLQVGFWLSFVAVGVLFASDSGAGTHRSVAPQVWNSAKSMFHQQWVITLAITPLTLLLFGQVSVVGLAANALAIPWVTLVVTPLALLGVLVSPLWDLAALAVNWLMTYLTLLSKLPFATISVAQAPLWAGAGGVIGGVLLVLHLPWSVRLLGVPLLLPVMLWLAPRPSMGQFELLAADVGQGNAVLVRTAKHALVYDAGPRYSRDSDAGDRVVVPLLRAYGASVDKLVLSHGDLDHVGGAPAVLAMQPKAELLSSISPDHDLQLLRLSTRCETGQSWEWDGVRFEVLHPTPDDYAATEKANALSCVLRITNGQASALLAGDIEAAQEAQLVESGVDLSADVLLVPHHGSKTSSSDGFLDAVKPHVALVQAGYRNRYGHPASTVISRYAQRGIKVFDSPQCGAATWRSEASRRVDCHRKSSARYWRHWMAG